MVLEPDDRPQAKIVNTFRSGENSVMIDLSDVCTKVLDFSVDYHDSTEEVEELYNAIMSKLYEIERNDDKDGTNNLERLLYSSESLSIAEIVEEYGLV